MRMINEYKPDVVGITSMSIEAQSTHKLAERIKDNLPSCFLVIGGAYASSSPDWCLQSPGIDCVVKGEGEVSFLELIEHLEKNEDISSVKGISYKKDEAIITTPSREFICNLDELPFPDLDSINIEKYFQAIYGFSQNVVQKFKRAIPVFTTRGCPYRCTFCHEVFGKIYRKHSPEYVINYLKFLVTKYGVQEIQIVDDCFNFDMDRAKQICRLIIKHKVKIVVSFPNGIRADYIDEEMLDLFKEIGVFRIAFGIESGNKAVQKRIKKELDLAKAEENIKKAAIRGFHLSAYFIIGLPGETEENIWDTINYACRLPIHVASFFYFCLYPRIAIEKQIPSELNSEKKYYFQVGEFNNYPVNTCSISVQRLVWLKKAAMMKFYFNWFRVTSNIRLVSNKYVLFKNLLTVIKCCFTGRY